MPNALLLHDLEEMVDKHGLDGVLRALSDMAHEKSEHVRVNWQDRPLSLAWKSLGHKLGQLALIAHDRLP